MATKSKSVKSSPKKAQVNKRATLMAKSTFYRRYSHVVSLLKAVERSNYRPAPKVKTQVATILGLKG